jgi:hypothetical protein
LTNEGDPQHARKRPTAAQRAAKKAELEEQSHRNWLEAMRSKWVPPIEDERLPLRWVHHGCVRAGDRHTTYRTMVAFSQSPDGPGVLCSCMKTAVLTWLDFETAFLAELPVDSFRASSLFASDPERDGETTTDPIERLHRALWRLAFPKVIPPPPYGVGEVDAIATFDEGICHRCNGGLVPRLQHDPDVLDAKWNLAREYILVILLENGISDRQPWNEFDLMYLPDVTPTELQKLVENTWHHSKQAGVNEHHKPFWDWVNAQLAEQFPGAPWSKRHQGEEVLHNLVEQCMPNMNVLRNIRLAAMNGRELDIYIPELKLALEYNGQQHYHPVKLFGGEKQFLRQQELDRERRLLCAENGIHLIEVRYDDVLTIEKIREWIAPFVQRASPAGAGD